MRKHVVLVSLVAAALAATVVAQRADRPPDRSNRDPRAGTERPGDTGDAPPPGMGPETKLEWYMVRPGKVKVRESATVGRIEVQPWDAGANAEKAFVRVNAITVRDPDNADDKASGVELIVEGEDRLNTFVFDAEQVPTIISAIDQLDAAAQKLREPAPGTSRRAVWTLNGLEIGMNPRRTGGYLAPMSPDERSTGLSPDDFTQLKRVLQDAKDVLARDSAR